jgi:hypothetical protein
MPLQSKQVDGADPSLPRGQAGRGQDGNNPPSSNPPIDKGKKVSLVIVAQRSKVLDAKTLGVHCFCVVATLG